MPMAVRAEDYMEADDNRFKKEELTQMLAPIALYPDSLIAQILMASTYPLEIVEAERWLRNNSELKGEALDKALLEKDWDASVKSLCHFPDVLIAMNENLERTTRLGDAFLGQEDEVMATIQELRRRADDRGNLKSTAEQRVTDDNEIITIEPTNPEVVYIPTYDPLYAYGPWWYPDYPPYYWRYPYSYGLSGGYVGFGAPFFLGYGLFSWTWFDWHHHSIHVDFNKTHRFHRHHFGHDFDRHDRHHWRHDPTHRRGYAYRHERTGERFGQRHDGISNRFQGRRGIHSGDLERRIRGPESNQRSMESRQGTGVPAVPNRGRFENRIRRDTSFGNMDERRFQRGGFNRGFEGRGNRVIMNPSGEIRHRGGADFRRHGEFRGYGGNINRLGGELRRSGGEFRGHSGNFRRSGGEFRSPSVNMNRSGGDFRGHGGGGFRGHIGGGGGRGSGSPGGGGGNRR